MIFAYFLFIFYLWGTAKLAYTDEEWEEIKRREGIE